MSAAVAESPVTTATSAFVSNTHLRVLLVESKATTRKVLLHMLERFGLDATVADAFGPAYTAAIDAQEHRHPFDLLIVDAFLPDLGALTLVNKLRNRGINPPVRYLRQTASLTLSVLQIIHLTQLGSPITDYTSKHFLIKPIKQNSLQRLLIDIFNAPSDVAPQRSNSGDDADSTSSAELEAKALAARKMNLACLLAEDNRMCL